MNPFDEVEICGLDRNAIDDPQGGIVEDIVREKPDNDDLIGPERIYELVIDSETRVRIEKPGFN